MADKIVVKLKADPQPKTFKDATKARLRVAAYARVSTDCEEQETSLATQTNYYKKTILEHPGWEFTQIYVDDGVSGLSMRHRDGFNQMIADCLAGRIDLVLTKSISRFARNTVDTVTTIRKLKENGVGVYFEKENIWTFDGKGELLITIMSSLAQEEARSISENCTWGQRKRFADGKVTVPFRRFLGYDRGEDGNLVVNPEQAKLVKRIYGMFLTGMSPSRIAKTLTDEGIKSPGGSDTWNPSCVKSILTNEKYKGDALLQKSYTVDFLTKKKKVNEGEIPQYYVHGNHEAIIDPDIFDIVQIQMAARTPGKNRVSCVSIFSSRIKCACCGSWYGPKLWHSNDKYRRTVWQCNHKFQDEKCTTPSLSEEEIKTAFLKAANKAITDKDEIIGVCREAVMPLFSTDEQEREKIQLESELNVVAELIENCIHENASIALDQEEYKQRYDALAERFNKVKARHSEISNLINERQARRQQIEIFLEDLQKRDLLTEFREEDWFSMVDYMMVTSKNNILVKFKDGTEIKA